MGTFSYILNDTRLWPTLGRTIADGARHVLQERETVGAGVFIRTLDRANGMETTGPASIEQTLYGGMVAGRFLDTLAEGTHGPRDAVGMNHELVSGVFVVPAGVGGLVDYIV